MVAPGVLPVFGPVVFRGVALELQSELKSSKSCTATTSQGLLERAPLMASAPPNCAAYRGKSVLISGAGGSIGAGLCQQVLAHRPRVLVLFELNEFALYTVEAALRPLAGRVGCRLVPVLGSVGSKPLVDRVLRENSVQVVLHAAAYKHVPLVEANPLAGLSNNVIGTQVLARAADRHRVERFVLISSDKAVRPRNVMGGTKRLAELVVQDLAGRSTQTAFAIVRFGNVLGSSGSVVPLFQDQIRRGGPVTVTHPDIMRYFMTMEEAVQLVLMAGNMAKGAEIFVLDMGKPVRIMDLARRMITAAGYRPRDPDTPDGDIEITLIGLRPGEKLVEELTLSGILGATAHPKIFSAQEDGLSEVEIAMFLRSLRTAVDSCDDERGLDVLRRWVEGYGTVDVRDTLTTCCNQVEMSPGLQSRSVTLGATRARLCSP